MQMALLIIKMEFMQVSYSWTNVNSKSTHKKPQHCTLPHKLQIVFSHCSQLFLTTFFSFLKQCVPLFDIRPLERKEYLTQ